MRKGSQRIALIAVFAAITTVFDAVVTPGFSSGVWYGWAFMMIPINGMILGPIDGFLATLISVFMGHTLVFEVQPMAS
jgi:type IV secretory pathway VirB2 component (pilin)